MKLCIILLSKRGNLYTLFLLSDLTKRLIHITNQDPNGLSDQLLIDEPKILCRRYAQIRKRVKTTLKIVIEDFISRVPKQCRAIKTSITLVGFERALNNKPLIPSTAKHSSVLQADVDILSDSLFLDEYVQLIATKIEVIKKEIGLEANETSKLSEHFQRRMISWSTLYAQYLEKHST